MDGSYLKHHNCTHKHIGKKEISNIEKANSSMQDQITPHSYPPSDISLRRDCIVQDPVKTAPLLLACKTLSPLYMIKFRDNIIHNGLGELPPSSQPRPCREIQYPSLLLQQRTEHIHMQYIQVNYIHMQYKADSPQHNKLRTKQKISYKFWNINQRISYKFWNIV